jgi:hypothetical protein
MPKSNTATITENDVLDALAVAFEQVGSINLSDLQRVKAQRRSQAQERLTGKALDEACQAAMKAAHEALLRIRPDASQDEIMAAVRAVVDAPPPSVLASQAVDLAQIIENGIPAPTFLPTPSLGERAFYADVLALPAGHKKSGKSWTETIKAADLIRAGRHVVYIDQENGQEVFGERLERLISAAQIRERFHYVPFPRELPPLTDLRHEVEQIAVQWPDCLLIFDSMRTFMARYALDPNKDTDVEQLLGPIMAAVKNRPEDSRITVDVIDHSNRSTKDGDAYAAAGSFAKACGVDVVYFFELIEDFSTHEEGLIKLTAVDDRRGRLIKQTHYKVGGQGENKRIKWEVASNNEVGKMGQLRVAVEVFLTDQPKVPFTLTDLRKSIKGNDELIGKAADLVVAANPNSIFKDANPARKGSHVYVCDPERENSGLQA